MQPQTVSKIFRIVSNAVLLLMVGAILYACTIAVTYWSGIGV